MRFKNNIVLPRRMRYFGYTESESIYFHLVNLRDDGHINGSFIDSLIHTFDCMGSWSKKQEHYALKNVLWNAKKAGLYSIDFSIKP